MPFTFTTRLPKFADNIVEDVSSVPNAPVYAWHSGTDVVNVALIVTI
ncbi:hypothetical protein [Rhodococcus erythropolis]